MAEATNCAPGSFDGRFGQGVSLRSMASTAARMAAMCAGVEPQQPPTTFTPNSRTKLASSDASSSGFSG